MGKTTLKVGDTFQSTSGNTYSIVELLPEGKCRIRFNDEFKYEVVTHNKTVRKGGLKNPYYGKLFGKGYLGVGPYKSKLGPGSKGYPNTREYMTWINMLSRCYYDRYTFRTTGNKVYDDAEVCNEWLNFQVFSEWFTMKHKLIQSIDINIKVSLDKDILGAGSKLYSPETCSLVPIEINGSLVSCAGVLIGECNIDFKIAKDGTYVVILHNYKSKPTVIKGVKTKEECSDLYLEHKRKRLKELAEKYKHILELSVYNKLIQF